MDIIYNFKGIQQCSAGRGGGQGGGQGGGGEGGWWHGSPAGNSWGAQK
jgi:hypothetical protein